MLHHTAIHGFKAAPVITTAKIMRSFDTGLVLSAPRSDPSNRDAGQVQAVHAPSKAQPHPDRFCNSKPVLTKFIIALSDCKLSQFILSRIVSEGRRIVVNVAL